MSRGIVRAGGVRLIFAALLTLPMSAQDPHRPLPALVIPFDLVSNFEVVVQGQIGELGGLKFIVDTGSSYSAIDQRVAERLRLDQRPGRVFNFNHSLAVGWAIVPEIRIGPIRVSGIGMMVTKLADISQFAENADGIIGMDVLSRARRMSIDYEQRRISFEFDEGGGRETSAAKSFVVPVVIQGTSMRMLVDTGLQYMVLYKTRLESALPHLRIEGEPRGGAIGHLQVTQVNLPGVQIFGREAITPVLLLEERDKNDHGGLDGYLGTASLHARRLELDFAAKTLRWQ